jgi:hypothetical protein
MPTFGYPDTSEKFQDNLDLPGSYNPEVLRISSNRKIILVGDMNATLVKLDMAHYHGDPPR